MAVDPAALEAAAQHMRAGAFAEARGLLQRLVQEEPAEADLWRRLGQACQALRDRPAAEAAYREALRIEPHAGALNDLGIVLMEQGRFEEAAASYHEALRLRPDYALAHNNLGIALAEQGKLDEAADAYGQALRLQPDYPEAHNNLGLVLQRAGRRPEAEACFRRAVAIKPGYAQAHVNLGNLHRAAGRRDEAAAAYREAMRAAPGDPRPANELAVVLMDQGRFAEAEACCVQALRMKPDFAAAHNNLGVALTEQGRWDDGMASYRQALSFRPDFADAHHNLGRGFSARGMADEAIASFERAVQCKPDAVKPLNDLGNAYKDQGRIDEAVACYHQALAVAPLDAAVHSNLLFARLYRRDPDHEAIFREHQEFGRRRTAATVGESPAARGAGGLPGQDGRRLRVGYVSADFRTHVMGSYSELVLAAHDRGRFEVFCYSDVRRPDAATERIQALAEHWRQLAGLSTAQAAELVRQDGIDLLIDLAGHTGGNRLPMFALRPAPVQATHFGYPATSGLATMDYRITDAHCDPAGKTERWHTERLIRLPDIQWCYRGGPALDPGPPPALQAGRVVFGCFNTLAKVTDDMLGLCSRILRALPGSRLHLLGGTGAAGDRRVLGALACAGVPAERVTLFGRRPVELYFELFRGVDVCLDPFPYTGCNTTADAVWMGVPVVTLAGDACVMRQGLGVLRCAGLDESICDTPEAYVETAVRLAGAVGRLSQWRAGLREQLRRSPLMDAVRYTRNLEAAYLTMWQERSGATAPETEPP